MTRNGVVSSQVSDAMLINHHYHFHMSVGRHESSETDKKVWVSQSNANSGKRFCTLNIYFRPEGGQPWVSIIFRGQGLRLSQTEKQAWDEDVDVYFQTNAWVDTPFCVKWVDNTLKKAVQEEQEPFVFFCDNLEGQKAEVFKESVEAVGGIV